MSTPITPFQLRNCSLPSIYLHTIQNCLFRQQCVTCTLLNDMLQDALSYEGLTLGTRQQVLTVFLEQNCFTII